MENRSKNSTTPPVPVFLAATVVIFFLTLSAADSIGFVPNYIDGTAPDTSDTATSVSSPAESLALANLPELGEEVEAHTSLPANIEIDSISLDLSVQNPSTRDTTKLDELLQKGPARYVDSAKLGEVGTMIIFAHSSHLPIVHNQMFKAFNRIPELKSGETITITGQDGKKYLYSVVSVEQADANDATIDLSKSLGTRLVLVTCDTLTSKSSRFILTADYIGTI